MIASPRFVPALVFVRVLSALPWFASATLAGPPLNARDDLLRLAPPDAGFCLLVQDWREQLGRLARSPAVARFGASPYGQALIGSAEAKKFASLDEKLKTHLNVSWPQLRDEILGDAFLLAYTPGPPGKPEAEAGVLLVHIKRTDLFADMLQRLNAMQQKSGELVAAEERRYRNYSYAVRRKKGGGEEFYFLKGQLLVFSAQESALRAVIDRDWDVNPPNIDMSPLAARLRALGVGQDFVVWWLNPRAFDAAVEAKAASARGAEAAVLRTFLRYWKACDGAAVSLALNRDVSLNLAVQTRTEALPEPARRLASEAARPSTVWAAFPDNVLFAAAGRVPWEPAAETGGEFLTPEARSKVQDAAERTVGAILGGRDILPYLLRHIGPDWGVCVTPPMFRERGWLPTVMAVLRLQPAAEGDPPVEQRVLDGLDFIARLAVLSYNTRQTGQLRLRLESQDGVEMRVIDGNDLPQGLQPAFAWKGGYLVLATNPDAVRRFVPPSRAAAADATDAEVPLVKIALQGWAGYLRSYRGPVSAYLANAYHVPVEEAKARVDRLAEGLEMFDNVEVVQRTTSGRAVLTVRLKSFLRDEKPH
jgi:hypothetical protein